MNKKIIIIAMTSFVIKNAIFHFKKTRTVNFDVMVTKSKPFPVQHK